MYRPVLVTAPAAATTLVTLVEAKAQLRVDHTDDDDKITALITAAVGYVDGWTGILGRCLLSQTWRQDFDSFCGCLRLPLFPVISITSVKYDDASNVEQTVSSANYSLLTDDLGSYVAFLSTYAFPVIDIERPAVRVAYVAGYADADSVPPAIKHALLMLVGHWYENRESINIGGVVSSIPLAFDALISPYRRVRF